MLLQDIFNTLSNQTEVSNENVYLDPVGKIVVFMEPGMGMQDPVGILDVPEDFNIFKLLNLSSYPTDIEGWSIVFKNGSFRYEKLDSVFQQVREIQYHMAVPQWVYYFLLALYLPVVSMGVLFNLTTITVILFTRKLRVDPRNSFIVALAISDLSLCIFTSPLTLWYTLEGHWPLGGNTEYVCKFVKAGQDFPIFMSSFCIGAIACDRFRYIVQPLKSQMTANQGFLFSFLLVIVSSCFVSPIFFKTRMWHFPVLRNTFFCDINWEGESRVQYTLVSSSFHFLLTLVVVVFLYSLIYYRLKKRPPSQNEVANARRRRTTILMASITITFFCCWTPLVLYCFIYDFHRQLLPQRDSYAMVGYTISLLFGLGSSVANPILYTLLNDNFQGALKSILANIRGSCILERIFGKHQESKRNSGPSGIITPKNTEIIESPGRIKPLDAKSTQLVQLLAPKETHEVVCERPNSNCPETRL
eukprot:maker-scaffold63_size435493-snap-gene-1.12 protein:Tk00824 transcript:maker-scaffold63_size435493-snap-gene-1.12-mRNA-1 annotation:"hypothetical protein TRIADDRAFT_4556"